MAEPLTAAEVDVVVTLGKVWNEMCTIVGHGPTRDADLNEIVAHIHALQRTVLGQAAARMYPDQFRLLGEVLQR